MLMFFSPETTLITINPTQFWPFASFAKSQVFIYYFIPTRSRYVFVFQHQPSMGCCPYFGRHREYEATSAIETVQLYQMSGGQGPDTSGENRTLPFTVSARTFIYSELTAATKNFSADLLLGHGELGYVYKGSLDNGQAVAVKQMDRVQGNREFLTEVLMLSLIHHEHIVNLIGYCADGDHRMLVYEFMALGSLEDHLHDLPPDKEPLDWKTRMRIAAGAAEGLEHLHEHANPSVIHRGLKSSSVLLGEGYFPKLSDFGLAKLGPVGDESYVTTRVMGTMAYCDPEYAASGRLTVKSDIYSFGVVLLEIISGRRVYDPTRPALEQHLVSWAHPLLEDPERFHKIADPALKGQYPHSGLSQALAIAATCLEEHAASRPTANDVMTALLNLASQEEAGNDNNGSPSMPESPTEAPSDLGLL